MILPDQREAYKSLRVSDKIREDILLNFANGELKTLFAAASTELQSELINPQRNNYYNQTAI